MGTWLRSVIDAQKDRGAPEGFLTGMRAAPFRGSSLTEFPQWVSVPEDKAIPPLTGGGRHDFFPFLAP